MLRDQQALSAATFGGPPLSCDCHFHVFGDPAHADAMVIVQALAAAAPGCILRGSDYAGLSHADKANSAALFNLLKQ